MKKLIFIQLVITMMSPLFSQLFNAYSGMGLSINTFQNPYLSNPFLSDEFGISGENSIFFIFQPDKGKYRIEPSIGYRGVSSSLGIDIDKITIINIGFKVSNLKELSQYTNSYKGILFQPNMGIRNGETGHISTSFSALYGLERKFEKVNIGCELLFTNSNYCPNGADGCIKMREFESKFLIRLFY